jgi:hypothetical protein
VPLEAVAWVIDACRRINESLCNEHLVEHRQLDRNHRQVRFRKVGLRRRPFVTVAQV